MTTPRPAHRRPRPGHQVFLVALLALVLLLMQQLGLQHGLTHLASEGLPGTVSSTAGVPSDTASDDHDGDPHAAHACGLCLAHAALAFALPAALAIALAPTGDQAPPRSAAWAARATPHQGPSARGPPAFLR
ncbi:DUF2946 family protein [Ideonella sp. A 288]|uniref:DUF2946 family protein n=1 Tax=Ideonella sp. A 288 TaxID=1962181 RepID=UPI000B4B74DD|nr:DUF2946 family protein [Ideonella sp. A 288]